jgi:hypothetical protein
VPIRILHKIGPTNNEKFGQRAKNDAGLWNRARHPATGEMIGRGNVEQGRGEYGENELAVKKHRKLTHHRRPMLPPSGRVVCVRPTAVRGGRFCSFLLLQGSGIDLRQGAKGGSQQFCLAEENKKAALSDGFHAAFKNDLKRL